LDFVKNFEKKNKPQLNKYKKYFAENDWSTPEVVRNSEGKITYHKYFFIKDMKSSGQTFDGKEGEYKIQHKIAETVLDRLSHFADKTKADKHDPKVKKVVKQMMSILKTHMDRIDSYISSSSNTLGEIEEVENDDNKTEKDYKSEEIEFDNLLYRNQASLEDKISKLDIADDKKVDTDTIEFLNNVRAPLSLHHELVKRYPEIRKKIESMGIDFTSPPKNEMLIHIENPPEWNEEKHYFEQDKKTLQFYVDEYKKIENGITIDGIHITPWMYCHLNIFKTPIPYPKINPFTQEIVKNETEDKIEHPSLRDNEWFIIQDSYEKARLEGKILFLCATRRAAKTTLIASHLYHKALTRKRKLMVVGSSSEDLSQIEGNYKVATQNAHPAFQIPNTTEDWTSEIKLGIKTKNQKDILTCILRVVNLNKGSKFLSEKLAGFTPDAFVLDEAMKAPFLEQLSAARPAFGSVHGMRLTPIISGTGGNEDLSKDALIVLKDPPSSGVSEMDWDALERGIPKELITWKRRKFGTFLPGQMAGKIGLLKKEKALWQYLKIPETKKLNNIKIRVTDWENAINVIKEDRKKAEKVNKQELTKEVVYFPIDPEEIFLSGRTNPFPHEEIKRYLAKIEEEGDVGKKVILDYDDKNKITYELSDKEYPDLPYGGGFHDAPVTIFEDPIPDAPFEFYVCGLDNYKQEQSDGDSVGSFTIIRRDNKKVVASYHSRPDPHSLFHKQGLMLLEMYNAPVFMENADMDFKTYTDAIGYHITDKYLVKSLDFLGDMAMDANGRRAYGWTPTPKNKSYLLGIAINYAKEQVSHEDEEGKVRIRWGFERIKDTRILQEMISFKPDGNFDTITSLMSALGYDYYLTYNFGAPVILSDQEKAEREKRRKEIKKTKKVMGLFPPSRGRLFR
jgi:hypothetical protein